MTLAKQALTNAGGIAKTLPQMVRFFVAEQAAV